ncbi:MULTISPECIES: 2Fe-2S iron-sulfur cluster-binding protein [Photorhabdus]|uniref:(2Fe-2S)-binding protein n=1 Tax=Photorhabdus laumondii subsp. clarkei TaxID=2029685 RepID=A0A329VIY8_9GAMM|nr:MULTISPECIES: 2Fe-2S iron-sulfur cluster-binding protein [Photorhabdus]PQQ39392.1 (2Fe-2S)-binding protein [Photorhabdus luminescens]NHB63518.1 (2Fe-2S)-binding protein [Photorhabdus sp. RW14-46]RAW68559.1 (2Fe-2S)-binding protein [Photorhabdus sp. S7-51]RAW69516.1 (2Fe-2S)-binding protein [Photorhabdus sp. S14-60]RAW75604.1 (2Fe-2S)-binding protein [Photorhabdus sp. S15-56]
MTLNKPPFIALFIDGELITVPTGITVAAALAYTGDEHCRISVSHQLRVPFCGMGICQECRLMINGRHCVACQTVCEMGMKVERI